MPLTLTDRQNLQSFINNQDRYGYWSYLSQKGDPYAKLALGVVTNETLEGYIANQYAAGRAVDLGKTLTEQQWWAVGEEIMEADFNARFGSSDTGLLTLSVMLSPAITKLFLKPQVSTNGLGQHKFR